MTSVRQIWRGLALLIFLSAGAVTAEQATTAPVADPVRHMSGPDSRDAVLVRQQPEAAYWLAAGEDKFAVMDSAAGTSNSRGTVVIVADAGQTAAEGLAGQMHGVLAPLGWRVISLGLPPLPLPERVGSVAQDVVPVNPEGSQAEAEEAPSKASPATAAVTIDLATPEPSTGEVERFAGRARARVGAAVLAAGKDAPGALVLVGIGLGAGPLTRYLLEDPSAGSNSALAWILPRFQGSPLAPEVGAPAPWMTGLRPWPILDITDSRQQQAQARARRQAMQRLEGKDPYRQDRFIIARGGEGAAHQLGHRIHGWALTLPGLNQ